MKFVKVSNSWELTSNSSYDSSRLKSVKSCKLNMFDKRGSYPCHAVCDVKWTAGFWIHILRFVNYIVQL